MGNFSSLMAMATQIPQSDLIDAQISRSLQSPHTETYLDLADLDPLRVNTYKKWFDDAEDTSMQTLSRRIGMLNVTDPTLYHKYCGFNKFTKETFPVPDSADGWLDQVQSRREEYGSDENLMREFGSVEAFLADNLVSYNKWIRKACDPTMKIFTPEEMTLSSRHPGYRMYKTLDNYAIGFIVFIQEEASGPSKVYVYGRTSDMILDEYEDETTIFTKLVKEYTVSKVFIGKSPLNKMTEFSGGDGDKWDGNSILLKLDMANTTDTYAFVGTDVFEFSTDEPIHTFVSSVGNNCVPYPYAESENYCYSMSEKNKTPVTNHPNRVADGMIDYVKNATYEPFDRVKIAKRDSEAESNPISHTEKTRMVRFNRTTDFKMCARTCGEGFPMF